MLDWTKCTAVERSPARVSGAWVFRGTRVPVKALFENLEDGATLDQFLEWFPGATREQALAVLEFTEGDVERILVNRLAGPFKPLETDWRERVRQSAAK
ncbi:MAG TPA: DUF433 domain-containing protein [Chthoniobacterales bacterium]|nr:DUF433 domain-containing protein [Chthoniobacterales bacterium]